MKINSDKIRKLIKSRGWAYNQLARLAGIKSTTLSMILKRKVGEMGNIEKIANALDLQGKDLIE